jgi:hypothetical protein
MQATVGNRSNSAASIGGAVAAGVGYSYGTVATSIGNSAFFGDPMPTAGQFLTGLGVSMATGGVFNGAVAAANGWNFWTGNLNVPRVKLPDSAPNKISNPDLKETVKQYNAKYQDISEIKLPEKLYHYTDSKPYGWNEIRQGKDGYAYFTTDGSLKPLNASLDLALPNSKIPGYRIEILTTDPKFNLSNIDIVRSVNGNVYGRGGGGWEILYRGTYLKSEMYKWNITTLFE